MNKKIRWGIAGTGRIAQQFVQDFEYVSNGVVVAVSSRSQASADDFAQRYNIPTAHAGFKQLLADPQVDAVYIASPHTYHYQNTLAAIHAGKHVLCEKPFTINPQESINLFAIAARTNVFIMEAMWTYFLPAVIKAKQWVEQGRIGKVRRIHADFGYPQLPFDPKRREYDVEMAGGCLLEMGIYPVALVCHFITEDPIDINVMTHLAPNGVEDDVAMLFDYGDKFNGLGATLGTSYRCKLPNSAHIIGEEGTVVIPDFFRAKQCSLFQLDNRIDHFEDGRKSIGLNYETIACGEDILAGKQQNQLVPWAATIRFQELMSRVKSKFPMQHCIAGDSSLTEVESEPVR